MIPWGMVAAGAVQSVRIQFADAANGTLTMVESSLTTGYSLMCDRDITIKKMGIVPRSAHVGSTCWMRFGIWQWSGSSLLSSTAQEQIVLSRTDPAMLNMSVPFTCVAGTRYTFGVYMPFGGTNAALDGTGSGVNPLPPGYFSSAGSSSASDGFAKPGSYSVTKYPAILVES